MCGKVGIGVETLRSLTTSRARIYCHRQVNSLNWPRGQPQIAPDQNISRRERIITLDSNIDEDCALDGVLPVKSHRVLDIRHLLADKKTQVESECRQPYQILERPEAEAQAASTSAGRSTH